MEGPRILVSVAGLGLGGSGMRVELRHGYCFEVPVQPRGCWVDGLEFN